MTFFASPERVLKKLSIILLVLFLFTNIRAKQRKCPGCKWCVIRTQKMVSKKRHPQGDCSKCHWCITKKHREDKKSERLAKHSAKKEEIDPKKEEVDPDLLAQELIHAIKTNRPLEKLEQLLDQGASLDWSDKEGRTALHWAAIYAQPYTVSLLLIHQANIEARDYRGNTPLHLVVKYRPYPSKRKDIIQYLIFEGASIYERNGMGFNVLESSIDMGIRRFALLTSLKPAFVVGQITF
jgi:hypothetical protein